MAAGGLEHLLVIKDAQAVPVLRQPVDLAIVADKWIE